jgi:hypothetical protein
MDRFFARMGWLDDAAPLFRAGLRVPHAGVLLAVPALLRTGVLTCAREIYSDTGPAFYGLRSTLMALLLMALLRIKRPEALKEHAPDDLGRLLGLDRAPEVRTLRRQLGRLADRGCAAAFGRALAQRRVRDQPESMGFLYVDGHVRVYNGVSTLPKTHVARMRICMPATTDYWVNDCAGEPLFVVTAEANEGLAKMLLPLLDELRALLGERRVTIVFDRGGWDHELFRTIVDEKGFDILTYRKAPWTPLAEERFLEREAVLDGRLVRYRLCDEEIALLQGRLRLRQITRLTDTGHQTPILTSRRDLPDVELAWRMFERWRQENFFKYMREEYALDALADHQVEPADPAREVPNPHRTALDIRLREARAERDRLAARLGEAAQANPESRRRTMRGFKIAHAALAAKLRAAAKRCRELLAQRATLPRRIPVAEAIGGEVVKLATERKHLANLLKMVAHQAESELVGLVAPVYARAEDEGRTLVQAMLAGAGDITVSRDELRITLAPLSASHRSKVLVALCEKLNREPTRFPGTRLTLRYAVAPFPDLSPPCSADKPDRSAGPM